MICRGTSTSTSARKPEAEESVTRAKPASLAVIATRLVSFATREATATSVFADAIILTVPSPSTPICPVAPVWISMASVLTAKVCGRMPRAF
ncbi:MAG: hypothetical protein FJ398_12640 [Verrucomicrobia bacterium]|nr:hypothetical protein [Verrucomicrobiota bacterium]